MTQGGDAPALLDSTVAIVGLGLLGGSVGRALVGACARRIGVVAPGDADAERTARAFEVVDELASLGDAVAAADIVVLATPVREIVRLLPEVARHARPGTLVTDVGSTKVDVLAAMGAVDPALGLQLVGGHPMAGGTASGVGASDPELFSGARWAICPVPGAAPVAVERLERLVLATGADPVLTEADEHDRAVALVSHLPRLVAMQLVALLEEVDPDDAALARTLAGRGWAGATRLAAGDDAMWDDVLATNAANVTRVAAALAARLAGA
ncbi:MAG: Prephenate dehydrogenase [Thermoleophilia bacterium]|nr:Prephenate dehydrogenase [Thermoleophilia bacterium]